MVAGGIEFALTSRMNPKRTLGDLVAALYDQAALMTADRRRATRLAAGAVARFLVRTGNVRAARKLAQAT